MSNSKYLPFLALEAGLKADREAKVLYGVQVAMLGEAKGHNCELDDVTLNQIVELGNARPDGVKARFGHATICQPGLGTFLGMRKNFVRDGNFVRADLHMSRAADPAKAKHVLDMAELHPSEIGNSVVISAEEVFREDINGQRLKDAEGNDMLPVLRVNGLHACDVVDQPASGTGMFDAAPGFELTAREHVKLRSLLDNPEFVTKALDVLNGHAEALGLAATAIDTPESTDTAEGERKRVASILAACEGQAHLSTKTKEYPNGLQRHAVETGMSETDFYREALGLANKAATMNELMLASDEILVQSFDIDAKVPTGAVSLEESFYNRFLSMGYDQKLARSMATEAAKGS